MLADYEFYKAEYLMGQDPVIPEAAFPFWDKQAEKQVQLATQGRAQECLTCEVKECACELAELLYTADQAAKQGTEAGGMGLLTSYSNDGQSASFDVSSSVYTESGKQAKVREIIRRHLAYTGLLYAGVRRCES